MKINKWKTNFIFIFFIFWFFFAFFNIQEIEALNKINNWNFTGNAGSWTATNNGTGIDGCGLSTQTNRTAMTTFAYDGTDGNPSGSFKAVSNTGNNTRYKAYIRQQVTAPGSGTVKVKGRFDYSATSTSWRASNTDGYIRVDLYNSGNTSFVANLACQQLPGSNVSWTTVAFGSNINTTGGTVYTVRVTLAYMNNNRTTATLKVDNIIVDFAPTGLSISAPADTTNTLLNWTTSTSGTGANGLHGSNPYKIYRATSSPVSIANFLANSTTNSYTDNSTVGNTTYYYVITDIDTANVESPFSTELNILTRPNLPGTPTFANVTDTSLMINWSVPTGGASSYKIERCSGSGCNNFSEIKSGETGTSYNDSGLIGNTLYRYRIRATNSTGDGAYSGIGEITANITPVVSLTITSDGIINYGIVPSGASKNTIQLTDAQTVKNDSNITENFNIKTSNATGGTAWTLGSSPGSNVFVHEFSTDGGNNWTKFTSADNYQSLATGVAINNTKNFDLQISTPSLTSDYQQKSITITIQAVAQ